MLCLYDDFHFFIFIPNSAPFIRMKLGILQATVVVKCVDVILWVAFTVCVTLLVVSALVSRE